MQKKGYALKRQRGLVPYNYDKNSKSFHQGVWKNWTREELRRELNPSRLYAYDEAMRNI